MAALSPVATIGSESPRNIGGASSARPRVIEIDSAKGLAILLVVIGHIEGRTPLTGNEWYGVIKEWVYLFHMPFFMFLSGFVMEYTFRPIAKLADYTGYVRSKFLRLMPAFVAVSALIVLGKTLASRFLHVDNVPEDIIGGLGDILIRPVYSSASALWYIYVLFIYYLLYPVLLRLAGGRRWPLLLLALPAYAVHSELSPILALNRVAEYWLFLMLGVAAARNLHGSRQWLDRFGWMALALFTSLSIFNPSLPEPKLLLGLTSIPALLFLIRLPVLRDSKTLLLWGRYVFVIYLLNTLCLGLVKGIGFKLAPWDGANFLVYFPILTASGLLLPILIKRLVLSRSPALDRMTA